MGNITSITNVIEVDITDYGYNVDFNCIRMGGPHIDLAICGPPPFLIQLHPKNIYWYYDNLMDSHH